MTIELYAIETREPCIFIRMLANHIGIDVKLKALDYDKQEHLSAEYAKISPLHKVPAINDDGFILYESSAICYYLLNKYAPTSPLYPREVEKRARVDQILGTVSSFVQPVASSYIRGSIVKRKKLTGDDLRTFEATVLCPLEQLVSDKTFAVGDTLTVADIRLVSIMSCFVPLPVVDKSRFSKLVSYYERVQALVPSFHEVCGWMLEQRSKEWETYE
ncbi:glutathione S-transferase 1-1-like [Dermacentor silvarum]|uniref:glutathione S-transferase 1-1-like n=1 Tax=Dermacentor silvarum TaxID=543639 RepID=UPI00189B11AF|nr:glutathione S-transferase 1-1-like [Dermacentor silvarum]